MRDVFWCGESVKWSLVMVPSSDFHIIDISISWIQPPGLIHLIKSVARHGHFANFNLLEGL